MRNFDITRWPDSFDDLLSGRAFRGAGQEFRAEAVPGTELQRYSASCASRRVFDSPYRPRRQRLLLRPRLQRIHGKLVSARASPSTAS